MGPYFVDVFNMLLLSLPGTPTTYYGEEIGMAADKPDPELRTPMQWNADVATAGFTTAEPWKAPKPDTATVNVAAQTGEADSMLSGYRELIRLRQEIPALRTGSLELLDPQHPGVLAFVRELEGSRYLCVFNVTKYPIEGRYAVVPRVGTPTRELLHNASLTRRAEGPVIELEARSAYVVELAD